MRRLGRYALLNRLSSGDRSDLFLARLDDRLPGEELEVGEACALELARADVAQDMEYARLLLAEGAAATRLRHPNVARTFEVERIGSDLFVASELLLGQTLGSVMQRVSVGGPALAAEVLIWIAAEVASGLAAAQERPWSSSGPGVMVHGGLSPRSVMLTYDGEVKVLGLGGGRARLHLPPPRSRLHYAPPEALSRRTPDRRTDLFSLGVVLHDALTGDRLFRRASEAETRAAITEDDPPIVRRTLEPFGERLAALIERMIARQPERRPKDADEVAQVLREAVGEAGTSCASQLVRHLAATFREEREAQRRVLDAAIRRGSAARTPTDLAPAQRPRPRSVTPLSRAGSSPIAEAERVSPAATSLEELVPEVMSGRVPLLAEAEDGDTLDLKQVLHDSSRPRSIPIPLVRRSSKPDRLRPPEDPTMAIEAVSAPTGLERTEELDRVELPTYTSSDLDRWIEADDGAGSGEHRTQGLPAARVTPPAPAMISPEMSPPAAVPIAEEEGSLEEVLDDPELEAAPEPPEITDVGTIRREEGGFGAARYRRGDRLGASEISTVHRATDAILGRKVALKTSEVGEEDAAQFDRSTRNRILRREARVAAMLFHPRIPLLLDAGREGELYFLAYQLIDGESLDRVLARTGKLPSRAVTKVLVDVAEALAYLHGAGWLHGDLQPANVILEPDGHARLIDLSSVHAIDGSETPIVPPSRSASCTPEVAAGQPYDAAAELFALGALAYRLLTGEPPFPETHPTALAAALARGPGAPAERDPSIDRRLSDLVLRLLEPDAPRRPSQASAVLAELTRLLEAGPAAPRARSAIEQNPPLPSGAEHWLGHLEQALVRAEGMRAEAQARDDAPALARATVQRLGLGAEQQSIAALIAAGRDLAARSGEEVSVLTGILPRELLSRAAGARPEARPGTDLPVEAVRVVEAYLGAIHPGEDGRRVSPRRAVLALRERADQGRYDARAVEALIDHLRDVISALEVPRRAAGSRRVLLAELHSNAALHDLLQDQGFELELANDGEDAWRRLASGVFDGAIVDRALPRPRGSRLLHKILDDARTRELPLVILAGGVDDTLDELMSLHDSVDIVARTAPAEQIVRVLHQRLRP